MVVYWGKPILTASVFERLIHGSGDASHRTGSFTWTKIAGRRPNSRGELGFSEQVQHLIGRPPNESAPAYKDMQQAHLRRGLGQSL